MQAQVEAGSSVRLTSRDVVFAWGIGMVQLVFTLLLAIALLLAAPVFRVYYPFFNQKETAADAHAVVRWLGGNENQAALESSMQFGKLRAKEVRHFADVRKLFQPLPQVLVGLGLLSLILVCLSRPSAETLVAAQWRGLLALGIIVASCCFFAIWDWKIFFAWLHYPFFGATSWKFSDSAYSLKLFPTVFWQFCGIVVLAAPCVLMVISIFSIRRLQAFFSPRVTPPKKAVRKVFDKETSNRTAEKHVRQPQKSKAQAGILTSNS